MRTPKAIRAAVRAVLVDPSYRANAQRLQAEMREMPGPDEVAFVLERLAANKEPVRR